MAAGFPELKLIELEENIGGEAFNRELESLEEEWVLLAENDMIFQPGWEDAFAMAIRAIESFNRQHTFANVDTVEGKLPSPELQHQPGAHE